MRTRTGVVLPLGLVFAGLVAQQLIFGQACQDEQAMVADYQKSITDLIDSVKKETLAEFQSQYHRKTCLTKLTLCEGVLDGTLACLEKAAQDRAATKEQATASKSKHDAYSRLKAKVEGYRNSLKGAEADKDAKALIEKFDLSS